MSLSAKGCRAKIESVLKTTPKTLTVELSTYTCVVVGGQKKFLFDFTGRVCLINQNNEQLHAGDLIKINSGGFYIKNRDGRVKHQFDTIVITEWEIERRNKYIKRYYGRQSESEIVQEKRRQRQAIEEEIETEEQDLDEYIENNGDGDLPF